MDSIYRFDKGDMLNCKRCGRFYSIECGHGDIKVIEKEEIHNLYYNEELSLAEIAEKKNVTIDNIRRSMIKYEMPRRSRNNALEIKSKCKKLCISKQILEELYLKKKIGAPEIAKKYNITPPSVYDWLKKFGIKTRDGSECRIGHKTSEKAKEKMRIRKLGKNNPNYKKPRSAVTRKRISEAQKGKVISEDSKRKMSEARKGRFGGKNHPQWRGGISPIPYPPEFNIELKKKIRDRDNYTCQECNFTEEQLGYILRIHHIDYNKKNNNEINLLSLCRSCHAKTNFNRQDWINYFENKALS